MMKQSRCDGDAKALQPVKLTIVPSPAAGTGVAFVNAFPQDRIADRPDPERRDQVEILFAALVMSCLANLVTPDIADTNDAALEPSP